MTRSTTDQQWTVTAILRTDNPDALSTLVRNMAVEVEKIDPSSRLESISTKHHHTTARMVYTMDRPREGWPSCEDLSPDQKAALQPIAETLSMLDGNAWFSHVLPDGREWWEQYLIEAMALVENNGGMEALAPSSFGGQRDGGNRVSAARLRALYTTASRLYEHTRSGGTVDDKSFGASLAMLVRQIEALVEQEVPAVAACRA